MSLVRMVSYTYDSGIRGLKQIWKSMLKRKDTSKFPDYTARFLDRQGFVDWYEKEYIEVSPFDE